MITMDLTAGELEILEHILENSLSDLRMEIAATDSMDFRDRLKERKRVIAKALAALGEG